MAGSRSSAPVFEFCSVGPSGPQRDVLGLWAPVHLSMPAEEGGDAAQGAMAFGTPARLDGESAEQTEEAPVWRASYPADRGQIASHLRQAERTLWASQAALAVAPSRLDAFLSQGSVAPAYSFATPGVGRARPESELSFMLGGAQGKGVMMNYGLGDPFAARWKDATQALQAFAGQLRQISAGFAWVETCVAGTPVGWTRVTWGGNVHTVMAAGRAADRIRLHQHTLDLALESRRMTLRMSGLIIAGAVKLTAMLSTGIGIAAAIPAVLRFVDQLRIEFEEYQRVKKEEHNV